MPTEHLQPGWLARDVAKAHARVVELEGKERKMPTEREIEAAAPLWRRMLFCWWRSCPATPEWNEQELWGQCIYCKRRSGIIARWMVKGRPRSSREGER